MTDTRCPKCGSMTKEGFLLDRQQNLRAGVVTWVEGAPRRSFFTGLRLRDRSQYQVITRRCIKCGFLESFAPSHTG